MDRQEIDNLAKHIIAENKNVLLQWATGCGKTKQAITAFDLLNKESGYVNNVLIVIAETAHRKNWIEEFNRWNPGLLQDMRYSISIICYDSLHHYVGRHFDLIILDEAHHIWTDIKMSLLKQVTSDRFILLSATVEDKMIYELEEIIGKIKVSKITLQEAIDFNILPQPEIILVPLQLDNKILNQTIEIVRGEEKKRVTIRCTVSEKWKYLKDKRKYPNLRLIVSCTERQKYNDFDEKIDYYQNLFYKTKKEPIKVKWLNYGLQRKSFLGQLKFDKAKEVLSTFGECRYICFCTDIEQADRLGGNHSIHTKKENPLKTIDDFNDKKINSLFVVGMLKEGQNLKDIERGLIIQLDGVTRPFIQKLGRVLRAEYPKIYIIYFEGTQDEVYLDRALENINKSYITKYENCN